MGHALVEGAKVMSKGQITLPKDFREMLGVAEGDRVVLIWDEDRVVMMNPAKFAMQMLQRELSGVAEDLGLAEEGEVQNLIDDARREH